VRPVIDIDLPYEQWDIPHGRPASYTNHACRCDACTAAHRAARKKWLVSLKDRPQDVPHGTVSGYRNWGCRCAPCTAARRDEGKRK
jgi:hypothetical protein